MATEDGASEPPAADAGTSRADEERPRDPAADPRADYDYRGGAEHRPDLVAALRERVDGDVRFDEYTRQLYATDASAYEVTPVGVVFPTSTADVAAVVEFCAERGVPVLPRGGGTSLAGQTVNEAVVLDFTRYMDQVLAIDPGEDAGGSDGSAADASDDASAAAIAGDPGALDLDPAERGRPGLVRAQPGVTLGRLNAACEPHGLKFAPDPAWGDKSALGGAIGNNSTGAHSLQYGKTDAYVESCEVVLADGTVTELGEVSVATVRERADPDASHDEDPMARIYAAVERIVDEHAEDVRDAYPDLKRNVSGYNLDRLVAEAAGDVDPAAGERAEAVGETGRAGGDRAEAGDAETVGPDVAEAGREGEDPETVNLARLLAGSEGTLAVVTEATVALEPIPETKSVALLAYEELGDAMADVAPILEHDPAAVEVLDDVLLDLAAETEEFGALVDEIVPEDAAALLLVEFYADSDDEGRAKVADLLQDRVPRALVSTVAEPPNETSTAEPERAFHGAEAHEPAERERFWKLRKSGLPILLSRTDDRKHVSFIEDCAVPPEHLPEYVRRFRDILAEHDTDASFYAHAGPGVLHVRPLVEVKSLAGVEAMASIADAVTDLVVELGGSVSGEHGDGRARTQWNRKLYGEEVWQLSRDLKRAFDPDWLLNPGQVCGDADGAADMTEGLRFDPDYEFDAGFEPELGWDEVGGADDASGGAEDPTGHATSAGGFQGMVELCHGCGGCRGTQAETGGVMCPTYRAADEESLSTRGRANALRQAMSGDLPADPTDEEFVDEILDLCIGCKGCARDCPSEVDMAALKAEVTHQHHREHGTDLRTRLFADVHRWLRLGSATAPVSNWLASLPAADWVAEKTLGIARERPLPEFASTTFSERFAAYAEDAPRVAPADAQRRALLFPDSYTEYVEPELGMAAVRVLEHAGVHVAVPDDVTDSGRPAYSQGMLDRARERAEHNVAALAPRIDEGWDVVCVEPSDAVMLQSDYAKLLGAAEASPVAEHTYGVAEYLERFELPVPGAGSADGPGDGATLVYHGHCHQTAVGRELAAPAALQRAGFDVEVLDSGCCGMAGSFGYEAEHFSMSEAIAAVLFEQVDAAEAELGDVEIVAPGTSCRSQFADLRGTGAVHPVEKLAGNLGR